MRNVLRFALCLVVLSAASFAAANTIQVTTAAKIEGNYGLELQLDGGADVGYVEDQSPADETIYRAVFWINKNNLYMTNCSGSCSTRFVSFLGQSGPDGVGPFTTVFRGILGRLAVDGAGGVPRYTFRVGARKDDGTFQYVGGVVLAIPKQIMIEWTSGAGNGTCKLYHRNDTVSAWTLVGTGVSNLTNTTVNVDQIRWGAVSGLSDQPSYDPLTTGTVYLDSFESYRTLSTP